MYSKMELSNKWDMGIIGKIVYKGFSEKKNGKYFGSKQQIPFYYLISYFKLFCLSFLNYSLF